MKRRDFTASLALLGSPAAWAQGAPVEGKDYVRLSTPVAVPSGGKIDVVEFFWYGCPHCNAFEPSLEAWAKKLPDSVAFRRAPVSFSPMYETHAALFYALEQSGQLEALHRKTFAAIHQQRQQLENLAEISTFVGRAGGDVASFTEAFKSFGVATKVRQAKLLSAAYKIAGVPAIGVHGRWFTAPSMTGGFERALAVTNHLIQLAQKPA
jgi:thiol:disulfide interchange protein DsbA